MGTVARWSLRAVFVVAASLVIAGCEGQPSELVVTTTADGTDAVPGDGVCEVTPGAGDCSLRAAIDEANASAHVRVVVVPSGVYALTAPGVDDTNVGGDLDLDPATTASFELRADVPGAVIDADGAERALDLHGAAVVRRVGTTGATGEGIRVASDTGSFIGVTAWANDGAGVRVDGGAVAYLLHSTLSSNGGPGAEVAGELNADHLTVTANAGAGIAGSGTASLGASLVVDQAGGADCTVVPTSRGANLDSDGTCALAGAGDGTVGTADLRPLVGTTVPFHIPSPSSPAVDAVPVGPLCGGSYHGTDQRSMARPQGPACDIGAIEARGFVVDATFDADDATPGDGVCDDGTGACTLRAAVSEANATPGTEPVEVHLVPDAVHLLALAGAGEDANATGDLDVVRPITVHGDGSTVHALRVDRPVHVVGPTAFGLVGVTLTGGNAPLGGGLRTDAGSTTTIERSAIVDNEADGYAACFYSGCDPTTPDGGPGSGGGGGGISAAGTVVVRNSTISRNRLLVEQITGGVPAVSGAAVDTRGGGTVALDQSTVTGNAAEVSAGSIVGPIVVTPGDIRRSTVADNDPDLYAISGASIMGSVIAAERGACDHSVTSLGHNVLSSSPSCGPLLPSDQVAAPGLVLPGNDPGSDLRLPLLASPAVDAIPPGTAGLCDATTPTDQRGLPRPIGAACDVGAIERLPAEDAGVSVLTDELPDTIAGAPYSASLAADADGPVTWALAGLPAGLMLDSATGTVSGSAAATGTFSLWAVAMDADGDLASATFSIEVDPEPVPTIAGSANRSAIFKAPFSTSFTAFGGLAPLTWSLAGTLPPGTTWNPATATISGTPTAVGSYAVQVSVTGAYGATATRTITIAVSTVTITTSALPAADVGVPYLVTLSASGGVTPYTWSLVGALPAGMSWNPATATISGLPTAAGTFPLTVQATDVVGGTSTRQLTLQARAVDITTTELPPGMVGRSYTTTLSAVGGAPPRTWSVDALPPGLVLDPVNGVILGTPTTPADTDVELTVTDGNGTQDTVALSLAVTPALAITTPPFPAAYVTYPYSFGPSVVGGTAPLTYALIGTRPPGLVWTTVAGEPTLAGTPTTTGAWTLTLRVTDAEGFVVEQPMALNVLSGLPPSLVVDSAADSTDASPGDGVCADALARCTLRAAIDEANAQGAPSSIAIDPGIDPVLARAGRNEDANATGDLDVVGTLTIDGGGATVSAAGLDRVVQHHSGELTLRDLTITGGDLAAFGGAYGGGILASADLTLDDVVVTGNVARNNSWGGGVSAVGSVQSGNIDVTIDGGALTGNVADPTDAATGRGGGLSLLRADATLTGTTVSGNTADLGGGIEVGTDAFVTTVESVVDANTARTSGGGVHGAGSFQRTSITTNSAGESGGGLAVTATSFVIDSLVAGNDVTSTSGGLVHGGGIAASARVDVRSSTLTGNQLVSTGERSGAAMSRRQTGFTSSVRFSTIADNVGAAGIDWWANGTELQLERSAVGGDGVDGACDVQVGSGGGNIIADASCTPGSGDLQSVPLELGPLADNGGPTLTRLPAATSPLVDHLAPDDPLCVQPDQRGVARPQGPGCDVGAVER